MTDYSTLLRDRVTLAVRSVDRIFLQGYVPHLQTPGWCARFLREQRGFGYPSSKAFGEVGKACETAIRKFAADNAKIVPPVPRRNVSAFNLADLDNG